jgi:DNA-binding winged helix-turn-helix (wHTH) protein
MRVNSAFTGFFNNRVVVSSGIAIMTLTIVMLNSSFTKHSDRDLRAKQVNLLLRQIGHRLLLQGGDSTSRVLPVTEIKEGTFQLEFENEMVFNHDSLMIMSKGLFPETEFPSGYTVTVHDCSEGGIVYGFQVNHTSPDILACNRRSQPPGCYIFEFAFPDFYENAEQKKAEFDPLAESVKVDLHEVGSKPGELKPTSFKYDIDKRTKEINSIIVHRQEVNPKPGESKTTMLNDDIDQQAGKPESVTADPQEVNPKPGESTTTIFDYPLLHVISGGMLVLLSVILLIGGLQRFVQPGPLQNQPDARIKDSVPESASLGKFLFHAKGKHLLWGSEVIHLTDKECKVLELLHKDFGELIPRDTLMQKVWLDEGVITGRSLDMFVSKLRKKLSPDPELRITNVHGKGYKLEIAERQII